MLRPQLPALSFWFHLKPEDLDSMPLGEIDEYLKALVELNKKKSKG